MKKSAALILALILAVSISLAACGGAPDVSGQVMPTQSAPETVPGGTAQQPEPTVPEVTDPEPTAPETTEAEEADPDSNLSLGRMEGGIYTNEYVGYACALDSNWSFLSAEELQQIPSTVSDLISGSELAEALGDTAQFTDMMAENINDLTTMNVLYQKLSLQERLAYAALSEADVVDATLTQKDMMIAAYQQAGILVASMEKVTVTFMGEERTAIYTVASVQDVPYYLLQFFDFRLGAYAVTTTLASYVEDNTAALTELFYRLEP